MEKLLAGMVRFQNQIFPRNKHLYEQLAREQQPETLFICCSDSRVVPHELTQTLPGELFICRNAGNIVPAHGDVLGGVSATVEYAVQVLKVKHIIVCGHSDCGAMRAVMHPEKVRSYRAVARWIRHAERVSAIAHELHSHLDDDEMLDRLIEENVIAQLDNLVTHPPVAAKMRSGCLQIHGMVFDIASGEFRILDRGAQTFSPLDVAIARYSEHRTMEVANG
jgi:carbonic anhydrase